MGTPGENDAFLAALAKVLGRTAPVSALAARVTPTKDSQQP
jgi:hypothetical protein